jgi:predicted transcriptional regulator
MERKEVEDGSQTLTIESKMWTEAKEKTLEKARRFDEGEEIDETNVVFVDPADVQRILTPKRMEMIETLMSKDIEVGSIRELAEVLNRNPSEVHEDVHTLEEYGIVVLRDEGRAKKPVVPYDDININVSLSRSNGEATV